MHADDFGRLLWKTTKKMPLAWISMVAGRMQGSKENYGIFRRKN